MINFKSLFLCICTVLFYSQISFAQVKIIQWSDAHSSLERLGDQLVKIDLLGQEYLTDEPDGEFIVFVNGDFTSINSLSRQDKGLVSLLALKKLRERGYTVIFTPGNHDAFDWAGEVNEAELFLQQMKLLSEWGVVILAANLDKPTRPLKGYIDHYYELKTLEKSTYFIGLTINRLMAKSNLTKANADSLFREVLNYEKPLERFLKLISTDEDNPIDLIVGAHESYLGLDGVSKKINSEIAKRKLNIATKLFMAGDDHLVASYKTEDETVISDGGSQGAFNAIEISKSGEVERVDHFAISEEGLNGIENEKFTLGDIHKIPAEIRPTHFMSDYVKGLEMRVTRVKEELSRVLFNLNGRIFTQKHMMKTERTNLGSLLAEALKSWGQDALGNALNIPFLAFVNSSSYRLEEPLEEGDITEFTVREMYPFLNEATVYRLKGEDIQNLFKVLRTHYAATNHGRYTPQISYGLKETRNGLKHLVDGKWKKVRKNSTYYVALDGWLSEHRFGESYQIEEWIEALTNKTPLATKIFQDVLVEYLPDVMIDHGMAQPPSIEFPSTEKVPAMCRFVLSYN